MKSLIQFINESKEKPMYSEYEIHNYISYMLDIWYKNNQNYLSILYASDILNKRCLLKECEIALTLLESLADVVKLHFVSARDKNKRDKYEDHTSEDSFYRVFKIIEAIASVEFNDFNEPLEKEIREELKDLKERINILVKNCNDKYDKWVEEQNINKITNNYSKSSICVPCDCCGCTC